MGTLDFSYKSACTSASLLAVSAGMEAQRQCVVIDASTKQPLRGVFVRCDNDSTVKTPWNGLICLPDSFRTVSFSHPKFERRILKQSELEDSVFMLPSSQMLNEVVVYGKRTRRPDYVGISAVDKRLIGTKVQNGFDLLGLFKLITNPISRSIEHKKEMKRQKNKNILDNY